MLGGAMFFPAEVMIISFLRSTTFKKPSSAIAISMPGWTSPTVPSRKWPAPHAVTELVVSVVPSMS